MTTADTGSVPMVHETGGAHEVYLAEVGGVGLMECGYQDREGSMSPYCIQILSKI